MAIYRNLDGTMSPAFQIGKSGPNIRKGTDFPTGGSDGDVYLRYGTTSRFYQRTGGSWVQLQSTQRQTISKSTNYTTTLPDDIIFVDTTSGPVTITLGNTSTLNGNCITVKDAGGNADVNAITIVGQSSQLIDGNSSITQSIKYGSLTMVCDGTNWYII